MTDLATRPGTRHAPALGVTILRRCALYLGPLSVAVAAAGLLGRLPWQVPAGTLVLGWSAAQALTGAGAVVTRRAGGRAGVRLIGLGFLLAAVLWCGLVLVAPAGMTGGTPVRALAVGLCGLTALATVSAALVGRTVAGPVRRGGSGPSSFRCSRRRRSSFSSSTSSTPCSTPSASSTPPPRAVLHDRPKSSSIRCSRMDSSVSTSVRPPHNRSC